jgi:hypothetical protein
LDGSIYVSPNRSSQRHAAILLSHDYRNELLMALDQLADLLQLLVRYRPDRWLNCFSKVSQNLRIDRICLGELSDSPREITNLPRIDNGNR